MKNALRILASYLTLTRYRQTIWQRWYRPFDDNPFHINPTQIPREHYLELAAEARERTYPKFMAQVERYFGCLPEKEFIDDLALSTQVVIKKSKLLYVHGYLLYAALHHYVAAHPDATSITILETGTARGFSALCMAKALQDAQRHGKIITIDILPVEKPIYWNCIHDAEGQQTRLQLLEPWQDLVEKYIIFLRGYTDIVLRQLGLTRIHAAFLDSGHNYETLKSELDFTAQHQQKGDVIICDDYTPDQFPGVVKAIDEFLARGCYEGQLFMSEEGRGYMYCCRTET